jgi:pyruvate/2-oxoglutarate dehydrogenase complex dihydrolipoamide acyltransferase (E2) component
VAEVELPQLGESVEEGVITAWLVEVGDTVEVDQPIVEISTDKVDTEIPSPVAGTVQELKAAVDDTIAVGAVIAVIGEGDTADTSDDGDSGDSGDQDKHRRAPTTAGDQEATASTDDGTATTTAATRTRTTRLDHHRARDARAARHQDRRPRRRRHRAGGRHRRVLGGATGRAARPGRRADRAREGRGDLPALGLHPGQGDPADRRGRRACPGSRGLRGQRRLPRHRGGGAERPQGRRDRQDVEGAPGRPEGSRGRDHHR